MLTVTPETRLFLLRHAPRASRRRARGAASVEAVIVLPIFILLLVSLLYVRDQALSKQSAELEARTCAWLYSAQNCVKAKLPPECAAIVSDGSGSDAGTDEVQAAFENAQSSVEQSGGYGNVISGLMRSLLGPALDEAFGRSLDANSSREIPRPGLFGGGTKTVIGRYHLACNLSATTPEKVAADAWHGLF